MFKRFGCSPFGCFCGICIAVLGIAMFIFFYHPSTLEALIASTRNMPSQYSITPIVNKSSQFPNSDGSQPTGSTCNTIATAASPIGGGKITYLDCGSNQPHVLKWGSITLSQKGGKWTIGSYTVNIKLINGKWKITFTSNK